MSDKSSTIGQQIRGLRQARGWTLADLARIHWPDVVPSPFPLITANQWYVTTRYPDIEEESPLPADIEEALRLLDFLMAAIATRAK